MRTLLIAIIGFVLPSAFAEGYNDTSMEFSLQSRIINALLESPKAQQSLVGEKSYSERIGRALGLQTAGAPVEGTTVGLRCRQITETKLQCQLNSFYTDGEKQSLLSLEAHMTISPQSKRVFVREVTTLAVGLPPE